MREIKFRAWEKNLEEFIPVHDINFEKKMINTESAWRRFDEIELMQYTGLKDKNGKEIYENDLLKTPDGKGCWQVVYNLCSFDGIRGEFEHESLDDVVWDVYSEPMAEVIGNIYENPELQEK
jgi:uncharacterized phage protein (TIGR01671 family)